MENRDKTAEAEDNVPREESAGDADAATTRPAAPTEIGGRGGLDPTRYGDWEKNGRCIDF